LAVLLISVALDRWVFSKRLNHPGWGLLASVAGSILLSTILFAIFGRSFEGAFQVAWRVGLAVLVIRFISEVWGWKKRKIAPPEQIFE
jgi:hypothetical protein